MDDFMHMVGTFFRDMFLYSLIAVFLENTIFSRALGSSTALFAVRKKYSIFKFGMTMTAIITVSSIITYFINPLIKDAGIGYYITPLIYVGVIAVVYVGVLFFMGSALKKHQKDVLQMIHVSAFNCAVLGALLLLSNIANLSIGGFLGFGIGSGIGFTFATFLVDLAYSRLSGENVPPAFRGFPITLIYMGIVSLAIYGLIGHELPF